MSPATRSFLRACRRPLGVFAVLILLLAATMAVAFSPLGPRSKTSLHLGVVVLQVGLIAVFFMNLRASRTLVRFAAAAGLYWLAIMFVLTFNDYASRPPSTPCPGEAAFVGPAQHLCSTPVP